MWVKYLSLSIVFLLVSCREEENSLFQVRNQVEFLLPAALNTIDTHFFRPANLVNGSTNNVTNFDLFNTDPEFKSDPSLITIQANRAVLRSRFGENLGFINSVSVWLYPADSPIDSNEGKEVFFMDFVNQNNINEIPLLPALSNVSDIITDELMVVEVRIQPRQLSNFNIDVELEMDYSVFLN